MRVWMQTTKQKLQDYDHVLFQAGIAYVPMFHTKPAQRCEREERCHTALGNHGITKFLHDQFLSLPSLSSPTKGHL